MLWKEARTLSEAGVTQIHVDDVIFLNLLNHQNKQIGSAGPVNNIQVHTGYVFCV